MCDTCSGFSATMAICYHGDESMHVKVKQQQWKSMVINTDGCHDNIVNNNMYLLTCELLFTQLRTYIRCSHGKVHCSHFNAIHIHHVLHNTCTSPLCPTVIGTYIQHSHVCMSIVESMYICTYIRTFVCVCTVGTVHQISIETVR